MFTSEKFFSAFSNNLAVIWQSTPENQEKYNYEEVFKANKIVKSELEGLLNTNYYQNIGVLLHSSAAIVPVILGILESNAAFCCLNPNQSSNEIEDLARLLRCSISIADSSFTSKYPTKYPVLKEFKLFKQHLVIIRLTKDDFIDVDKPKNCNIENGDLFQCSKIMFCCSTSGTTGSPKMVGVPFQCFMPNITSLSKRYSITQSDVIYISSPPTFDPFVVDLCLALFNGSTVLMVSNEIGLSPNFLQTSLQTNSVTIMQITPSLFRRWSDEDIRNQVLSSSLRCLIFGGEPFPSIDQVALWFNLNGEAKMRVRLFNIYGITEVSCWSSIYEVSTMDIECKNLIPIGVPLDQYTKLRVVDCVSKEVIDEGIGELFIETNIRKCSIGEVDLQRTHDTVRVPTGDLVQINSGTIYYKTRLDNIVKIYGRKVNLTKIENATRTLHSSIKDVSCVFDRDENSLNLFVQCEDGNENRRKQILRELRTKLLEQEVPNEIFLVDKFPLSCHGKISKKKLLDSIKKTANCSVSDYLLKKFEENLPRYNTEEAKKRSFLSAGGSSILALQIVTELENKYQLNDAHLMTMLLSTDTSIGQIFSHLKYSKPLSANSVKNTTVNSSPISSAWSHDMTKCIDASPTVCKINLKHIVSVGSHSHTIINVDVNSGELISKIKLPDRIESQVVQYNNYGIVGCYDGFVYCFDVCSGEEKWKFESGGMVKSKVLIIDEFAVFGNYNSESNLWCVRADDGTFVWNRKIGNKSIYANVQKLDTNLIVTTLDGVCTTVDPFTGKILWQIQFQSPIFSTPKLMDEIIIVAEVLGIVHCVDCCGNILWSYKANGNIYSSIESNGKKLIYFGCYDRHVYCLSIENDSSLFKLMWRVETPGQVFSMPKHFVVDFVKLLLVCTTNGYMCLIDESGIVFKQFKVDGEIFSTPSVEQRKVVIGSRNNLLYCFEVDKMLGTL